MGRARTAPIVSEERDSGLTSATSASSLGAIEGLLLEQRLGDAIERRAMLQSNLCASPYA